MDQIYIISAPLEAGTDTRNREASSASSFASAAAAAAAAAAGTFAMRRVCDRSSLLARSHARSAHAARAAQSSTATGALSMRGP